MRSLLSLLILMACCSGAPSDRPASTHMNILFVGNSLTYSNNLPQLIQELGKHDGVKITFTSLLTGGYSLEDHWNEGKLQAQLEQHRYDYLVAQQGPSALPESQILLQKYVSKIAEACKSRGTRLALYMVWPSKDRAFDHDNVIHAYQEAAAQTGSVICPAGKAWKLAWSYDSTLPLYSSDNFHPGVMGSLLAALTIYGKLQEKKDFGYLKTKTVSWKQNVSDREFAILTKAALESLNE